MSWNAKKQGATSGFPWQLSFKLPQRNWADIEAYSHNAKYGTTDDSMELFQTLEDGHVQMAIDLDKVFGQRFNRSPFIDGIFIKITFKKKPHCTGMFCIRLLKFSDLEATIVSLHSVN